MQSAIKITHRHIPHLAVFLPCIDGDNSCIELEVSRSLERQSPLTDIASILFRIE